MKIKVAGIDPALSNLGIARMSYDVDTGALEIDDLILTHTTKSQAKQVRRSSDDLARARQLHEGMMTGIHDSKVIFSEIPTGTQSARGSISNGISLGVLAACPIPLIEIQPRETKLASVGKATASKEEVIAWAHGLYPNAPWRRYDRDYPKAGKRKGDLSNDNEHLADAVAVVHAGIKLPDFQRLIALLRNQ